MGQQQQVQQQNQQQPAEFRQLQEPVFTPPLPHPVNNNPPNFQQFQQRQQQFNQQPQAQPQQQQQQQQFNQQQPQFNNVRPQPQQNFNREVTNFNQGGGAETLPTLPPVFIPPNTPQGPPPQLQSPIRNLFRQPGGGGDSGFSFTRIINRFFNLFNLNNN